MAIKIVYPKHVTVEKFYVLQFFDGSEYLPTHEYPCDKNGEIIFDDDANLWIEKYLEMVANGTKHRLAWYTHDVMQPSYVECECGNRFFLTAKKGRTCKCQNCGRHYDIYLQEEVRGKEVRVA
jgi:hypothetical protein